MSSSTSCRVCGHWQQHAVCFPCLAQFAPPRRRCLRCGITLQAETLTDTCSQCVDYPPDMDQVVVAVEFASPWSDLIGELKFQDTPALAHTLAKLLAQSVRQATERHRHPAPDVIVPIPLSDQRWHERGYNQAWLLAQATSRQLGWRSRLRHHTLIRQRETGRLMAMRADEREHRIKHAFAICPSKMHQIEGQHVVMVDDVMTTGATANEAARTLLAAGAASVTGWFAARTPMRRQPERCPAQ